MKTFSEFMADSPRVASLQEEDDEDDSPAPVEHWRTNPRFFKIRNVRGVPTKLYGIGALAEALGLQVVSVRRWLKPDPRRPELPTVMPDAQYRTKAIPNTIGEAGRRLWTEEQIELIVAAARATGVIGGKRAKDIHKTEFPSLIRDIWTERGWMKYS